MPCFFYVTNSVYMERKPETGKSTDKMENACYTPIFDSWKDKKWLQPQ